MVPAFSPPSTSSQEQDPDHHPLHLERSFVYDGSSYELTMDAQQDQHLHYQQQSQQYQQQHHPHHHDQQQHQEYSPLPWAVQESSWVSPSSWQGYSPQFGYPDIDMIPPPLTADSSYYSYSDAPLTTTSEEQFPMTDYFTYRRDSSSSSSSACSSSSSTSSVSSIHCSRVNYEEVKEYAETPVEKKTSSKRRACSRRHSTTGCGRPHQCGVCTRTFARRHDLERHTRVHTGIKPYVCPCCLKAFPRSDARGRHFRNEPRCHTGPQVLAFIKKSIRSTI